MQTALGAQQTHRERSQHAGVHLQQDDHLCKGVLNTLQTLEAAEASQNLSSPLERPKRYSMGALLGLGTGRPRTLGAAHSIVDASLQGTPNEWGSEAPVEASDLHAADTLSASRDDGGPGLRGTVSGLLATRALLRVAPLQPTACGRGSGDRHNSSCHPGSPAPVDAD